MGNSPVTGRHDPSAPVVRWGFEVLEDAQTRDDVEIEVLALDGLARCHAVANDHDAARDLFDAADQLLPSAQHLINDADRIDAHHARALTAIR